MKVISRRMNRLAEAKPEYSIVIINMNTMENLKIQLPVLTKFKGLSYEIIVVDNNSTDGSPEYIRKNFPNVRVIELKKNIGTAAITEGFRRARGEYIMYMGDLLFYEKTLRILRRSLDKDGSIGIAVPVLLNYFSRKTEVTDECISRTLYSRAMTGVTKDMREIVGCGTGLIRRRTVEEVGGFIYDPDYFLYGEDIDLGMRIRLIGKRSVIVPDAIIYHAHIPITSKTFSKFHLKFLSERNLTLTFLRTFEIHNIIFLFPYLLFTRFLGTMRDLFRLEFQYVLARNYALLWLLFHPLFISRKRKVSQSIRRVDDKYIFKPFSEKAIFSFQHG